jgi:uncharacterized protein YkwD
LSAHAARRWGLALGLMACLTARPAPAADFSSPEAYRQAQEYALLLINEARAAAGVPLVAADPLAAQLAKQHAEDMLGNDYFSHWDMAGLKPTRRYNLAGGYHALSENIYFAMNGPSNTQDMLGKAMQVLMDSEGHRRTILDPAHTHVGIGLALGRNGSAFYFDQEFITRIGGEYHCPLKARVGERIEFSGRYDTGRFNVEHVILGYEERPAMRDQRWLNRSGVYKEGEKQFAGYCANVGMYYNDLATFHDIEVDAQAGWFKCHPVLSFKNREGMYYLFLWLRDKQTNALVLAAVASVDTT